MFDVSTRRWGTVLRRKSTTGTTTGKSARETKASSLATIRIPRGLPDAAKIALHTRLHYLQLDRGNRQAASEIWAAVKQRDRPELLTAAVRAHLTDDGLDADAAVNTAERLHSDANAARKYAAHHGGVVAKDSNPAEYRPRLSTGPTDGRADRTEDSTPTGQIDDGLVHDVLAGLKSLTTDLRAGLELSAYDVGSLRLYGGELLRALNQSVPDHDKQPDAMSL